MPPGLNGHYIGGSMAMTEDEVRQMLRAACDKAGSQMAWANKHRITPAYVSDALAGKRHFGPRILAALGIEVAGSITTYRRIKR